MMILHLERGAHRAREAQDFTATELGVVSAMAYATHLPDGTPIARIKIHQRDGRVIERELQAGRDTAEWAYDRPDVRAAIKHRRPRIAESVNHDSGFPAYR